MRSPTTKRSCPLPRPDDAADDLVPRNERQLRLGQLAVDDVKVGAADPACLD